MTTYHGEWVKGVSAGGTRLLEETPREELNQL